MITISKRIQIGGFRRYDFNRYNCGYRWDPVRVQDGESRTLDTQYYELKLKTTVNVKSEIAIKTLTDINESDTIADKPSTKDIQNVSNNSESIMNFDKCGLHIAN